MSIEVVNTVQNLTGTEGFVGRHILLDVRTSTLRGVSETTTIYHLLEGLSMALGMTLVYPPLVARFPFAGNELSRFVESLKAEGIQANAVNAMEQHLAKRQNEEAGISGVTVWLESHAAIHPGPRRTSSPSTPTRARTSTPRRRSTTSSSSSTCSHTTGSTSCARSTRRRAGAGARLAPDRGRLSRPGERSRQRPAGAGTDVLQRALNRAGLRSRKAAFPSARSSVCARLRNDIDSSLSASSIGNP